MSKINFLNIYYAIIKYLIDGVNFLLLLTIVCISFVGKGERKFHIFLSQEFSTKIKGPVGHIQTSSSTISIANQSQVDILLNY